MSEETRTLNYQAYGGALELWNCREHEVLIHGPADTGKSRVCLQKVDALCRLYPKTHALFVRRHRSDMKDTVVQSLVQGVYGGDEQAVGVTRIGGVNPFEFHYDNGSIIRLRGMDDGSKSLGGEYDVIFVSQAEELSESNWNVLSTRVTGRSGHTPYPQLIADANPGPPNHFLMHRDSLVEIESVHTDNPELYDQKTGEITEQGKLRMKPLLALTGIERKRLLEGKWHAAEGIVYDDFDTSTHIIDNEKVPIGGERALCIDWGYQHPLVCQWWYIDPDKRMVMTREIYKTNLLVEDLAIMIATITKRNNEWVSKIVCDHDPEDQATLERHLGMKVTPAIKGPNSVRNGITMVKERLRVAHDGRPRLVIAQNALQSVDPVLRERRMPVSTEGEFALYSWKENIKGDVQDEPIKEYDHGLDALRYMVNHIDGGVTRWKWL